MKCPNCQSESFYLEDGDAMTFVVVDNEKMVSPTNPFGPPFKAEQTMVFNCTQCAWYGTVDELLPSN